MTTIVNLTNHALNFYSENDTDGTGFQRRARPNAYPVITVEKSSIGVLRADETQAQHSPEQVGDVLLPVTSTEYGDLNFDPPVVDGTIYVVSAPCIRKLRDIGRTADMFVVANLVRDPGGEGRVIGACGLGRI